MGLYGSITDLAISIAGMGINSSGVRQIAEAVGTGDTERIARTAAVLRRISIFLGVLGAAVLVVFSGPVSTLTFGSDQHAIACSDSVNCCIFQSSFRRSGSITPGDAPHLRYGQDGSIGYVTWHTHQHNRSIFPSRRWFGAIADTSCRDGDHNVMVVQPENTYTNTFNTGFPSAARSSRSVEARFRIHGQWTDDVGCRLCGAHHRRSRSRFRGCWIVPGCLGTWWAIYRFHLAGYGSGLLSPFNRYRQ